MPNNETILGTEIIGGVSPTKDANDQYVPVRLVIDDTFDPPRLVMELPDRALRDLGKVDIAAGQLAEDSAATSIDPVLIGAEGRDTLKTAVATGDAVRIVADRYGRLVFVSPKVSVATSNGTAITTATSTTVVAAPSANTHLRVHRIMASNSGSTATWVYWLDGSGGTQYYPAYLPQNGIVSLKLAGTWDLTGGSSPKALVLKTSAAGNVEWTVEYETVAD